jgi:hypothetical protein
VVGATGPDNGARAKPRRGGGAAVKEEKMFFFEKKNQKTFACLDPRRLDHDPAGGEGAGAEVFCFFFSKNKTFLSS